jgi:hypothetical protein
MHIDGHCAVPMTFFAASSVDIEGKITRLDAQPFRLWTACKQLADFVINFQIGRWILAQRPGRQFLPRMHHLADLPKTLDSLAGAYIADGLAGVA